MQATTRRNVESVNQVFGNKLAILGGDFLLSRASVSLARLRNLEVFVVRISFVHCLLLHCCGCCSKCLRTATGPYFSQVDKVQ